MRLTAIDWLIAIASVALCFIPALYVARRGSSSTTEFFASGRAVPWWLAGLSMVATTFSSDTPNLVTDIVRTTGVAGNWVWWAFVLTGMSTVFFYARMWRRSAVLTDLEFYELRYSGQAARVVRGFRAVYLGLVFNCIIMATVNLAACKIAAVLFGLDRWQTLLFVGGVNVVFAAYAGLWGVLVIDMIQFGVKMTAVVAAAYFALQAPGVGGLDGLITQLSAQRGPGGLDYLRVIPDFSNQWDLAVAVFLMPIAVQWWAVWYPGAEPGGGSYVAQRMLASKTEKDALAAVLFFNVAHYVLRPWPWILVGLASLIVYPTLADLGRAVPHVAPGLVGHDLAYPIMLRFLPVGFAGLMVGGLVAANSSTILTHLNWGASYLVHDLYRRFLHPTASEAHYVRAGRIATVGLFVLSSAMVYALDTAKSAFDIILQVGAGTGLLYLARWFWWRVNAWCEVVAMVSSLAVSVVLLILARQGLGLSSHRALVVTVIATTACWVATAYFGPQTDPEVLKAFYLKVRPAGPGWEPVRRALGAQADTAVGDPLPLALVGWALGCAMVWSSLFAIGQALYGEWLLAAGLTATAVVSGTALAYLMQRLWPDSEPEGPAPAVYAPGAPPR
jgi:SSS family solute:Na+ symporter